MYDNKKDIVVTIKEDKNNLVYQETMNVEIENIASKKQLFWRSIYEVNENSYFEKQLHFQQHFESNVEIIQMKPRVYHLKSKQLLKMAI